MKMRENFINIFTTFTNDEQLLRLLYYKPSDAMDDPLDPTKPDILTMDDETKWDIINDVIKMTNTTSDLDTVEKCRIFFYAGRRDRSNNDNYLYSNQELVIDILVHFSFENTDMRLSWICDRINDLVFNERVKNGIGKTVFKGGTPVQSPITNYVTYRLVYEFGSGN